MTKLQQQKLSAWLVGASAILVGIGSAKSQVEEIAPPLPQYWASVMVILGILCVAVGIFLWVFSMASPLIVWKDYECHKARKKDLDTIFEFARQHFGEGISSLETMKAWYGKNPSVFFVIVTEKKKAFETRSRIAGYYCVLPLKKTAIAKIESGAIRGRDIPVDQIARIRRECSAVYVGGLAAKGIGAKAALLAVLHKEFSADGGKWAKTFYTRPVTEPGLRIAMKKGFSAVEAPKHGELDVIYKLEI